MTVLDNIAILVLSLLGGLGILCNILLLVAIKSYSILLSNCALTDLLACICSSLLIERMIPFPDMTANVYQGPCTLISGFFCHIFHSIMLQTNNQSMYLIVAESFYRYYVISKPAPSPSRIIAFSSLIIMSTILVSILTLFVNDPSDEVREAMRKYHPQYQLDQYVVEGHVDLGPHALSRAIAFYDVAPVFPLLILVFLIRGKTLEIGSINIHEYSQRLYKVASMFLGPVTIQGKSVQIIVKLEEQKQAMTMKTREMHSTLVKVITLRAILPIFFFFSLISYVVMKKQIYNSIWLEYAIAWFHTSMPSFAPVITLFNVKQFRDFILCKKGATVPQKTVIAALSRSHGSS